MVNMPAIREAEMNAEEPYNASDPKAVNRARKKAARLEKENLRVVQALMQNKETRAWVYKELFECYIFEDPVVAGDVHMTYLNLGVQRRGKALLAQVMNFPDEYVLMIKEAQRRR